MRGLGRWDLVALVINIVIGAGILGLPAKSFALIGTYSVAGWVLCAFIMGLIAASFAEVGSRFAQTGGPYLYAHAAFGPRTGFLVGWLSWISRLFSFATIANLAITYAGGFAPGIVSGWPRAACIVVGSAVMTWLVLSGVRRSATLNNALTVCKVLLLGGFVAVCLPAVEFSAIEATQAPTLGEWQAAAMLMAYAFLGIESAMITSGEMRNPRADVPFALGVGLACIAVLYVAIQVACIGTLPELASSQRPLVDATERVLGPTSAHIVNVGALLTMLGTLFAILMTGARLPFAFAEQGQLPAVLASVDPRSHAPHVAIVVSGICACLLALYTSFLGALVVSALTRLVGYVTTCAALIVLRRRSGGTERAGFRVPAGLAIALTAIAACCWMMMGSSFTELIVVAALGLTGLALTAVYSWLRVRTGEAA
jgi:amino acid transporter